MKRSIIFLSVIFLGAISYGQTAFEYFNIGLVKYNLHNYTGAIDDFTRAVEMNPEHAEAYNIRGAAKYQLGELDDAIEDFNRSIEINSRRTGGVRVTISDHAGNVIESRKPSRADPMLAPPYYNRALARYAKEDYLAAIEDYSLALENDPEIATAYYRRGLSKLKIQDIKGACTDLRKADEFGVSEASGYISEYCVND
jgi:tetratricopeptide (TPR) repeat protein